MTIIDKIKGSKTIQRLFNIETREVSLVDHPAIDEPFIEVKSAKTQSTKDRENDKEEEAMEEKKVADMIQAALAPLAETLNGIKAKLEGTEKSVADSINVQNANVEKLTTSVNEVSGKVTQIIDEAGKRFEKIETFVASPRSQKINGEGTEGDKSKLPQPLWPSLSR